MHWIAGCVPSSTAPGRSAGSPPARMKASVAAAGLALALPAAAQGPARNAQGAGTLLGRRRPQGPPPTAQFDGLLLAIGASSIEARFRKLVSFHPRHTLSRTDSDSV